MAATGVVSRVVGAAVARERALVLVPGRNCWRQARARRAAVLVDGSAYFAAFAAAVERAERSILVLCWDINSRTRLYHDDDGQHLPDTLGPFLNAIVARRPRLHANILDWDFAMIYAFEREMLPVFKLGWRTHRRLHFRLDSRHPPGASHHQKVVVVDDAIAFVGGFDLAHRRWDTPEHRADEPRRVDPYGVTYAPFHDVQLAVDGEAARALGELARERWRRATGRALRPPDTAGDPWPRGLVPDFTDVDVAIARTEPAYEGRAEVREVERLWIDAILAAERSIYIEMQYVTATSFGDVLAARLAADDGPDVVMVLPRRAGGWLETNTMGVLQARLLRRLIDADRGGRLRIYCPQIPELASDACTTVHAKVLVVDDMLLRVGSSNLNHRSMGLDTECDLAIEGHDAGQRAAIARVRDRLLAEHLGTEPERVGATVATRGSLIEAVEHLRGGPRTLAPFEPELPAWLDAVVPNASLVDPERPISADRLIAEMALTDEWEPIAHPIARAAGTVFGLALLVVVVRHLLLARGAPLPAHPLAAVLATTAAYAMTGASTVPAAALIACLTIAYGAPAAFLYGVAGSTLGAALGYAAGRLLGRERVRRLGQSRLPRSFRWFAGASALDLAATRLAAAGFHLLDLVAGASRVRLRDYAAGTLIALVIAVAAAIGLAELVLAAARDHGPVTAAALVLGVVAGALAWLALRRRVVQRRRSSREPERAG